MCKKIYSWKNIENIKTQWLLGIIEMKLDNKHLGKVLKT